MAESRYSCRSRRTRHARNAGPCPEAGHLLHRERAQRLVLFHARDARNPSLAEVLQTLIDRAWGAAATTRVDSDAASHAALRRTVQRVVLDQMLDLAGDARATPDVRAVSGLHLERLEARIGGMNGGSLEDQAHRAMALRDLRRFLAGEDVPDSRSRFQSLLLSVLASSA